MTKDEIKQTQSNFEAAFKANQPDEMLAAFTEQSDRLLSLHDQHETLKTESAGLSLQLKAAGAAALTGDLKKLVTEKMRMGLNYDDAFEVATRQLQHDKNLVDEAARKVARAETLKAEELAKKAAPAAATPATKGK